MRPWLASPVLALVAGCTFSDGLPWGLAEVSLEASFEPPASRLDDAGRLKTSGGYAFEVERVAVGFDAVTVLLAGSASTSFDPAEPPEGFSLCHNGHCHADDGRLVAYDEVVIEASGGGARVARAVTEAETPLGAPREVSLGACSDGCELPRGDLAAVFVDASHLALEGRVYGPGLEGSRIALAVDAPLRFRAPLSGAVDNGEPVGVRVRVHFELTPKLLDGFDFAAEEADPTPIVERLGESALTVAVERFEP